MSPEKISSMHDDFEFPYQDRNRPDFHSKDGIPQRHLDIGPNGEKSVVQRIKQFGVTEEEIAQIGVVNMAEISERDYSLLVREALRKQYETLFTSVFSRWTEMGSSQEQLDLITRVSKFYKNWGFNMISDKDNNNNLPTMVIALEGANFVENLSDIDKLHDIGIGSVNIQYGEENLLANQDGLTSLGRQSVNKMLDYGTIIDLAHVMPRARKEIIDIVESTDKGKQLAYTHGATSKDISQDNQYALSAEERGLSDDEVTRIIRLGGIIGLGVSRPFFQSLDNVVERIDQICQIEGGPIALGLGTDFGGVPPTWNIGVGKPEDIIKIADLLSSRYGYNDALIRNVLSKNISNWVGKINN